MEATEVRSLFSKDLWFNTNPNQVSIEDFKKIESKIANLESEDKDDFKKYCETELDNEAKDSIVVRYLISICGRHPIDDNHIFTVLEQYYNARLWEVAIFIANRILLFNESSYVLRVLSDCYSTVGKDDEKVKTWERLVKADYSATETVFSLAEYYQNKGELLSALKYYLRVIKRHVKSNDLTSLKSCWEKLQQIKGDNADFMLETALKCANELDKSKAVYFLSFVFETGNFDLDTNIKILKKVVELDKHNNIAVDRLVELYREKYKENPRLDYCIEDTGILKNYMDSATAVENFEKEVLFVENAFVRHDSFGIGIIKGIEKDSMNIVFVRGGARKMSLSMAFKSLTVVPKTDISVLKVCAPADKLAEKFMGDVRWGLKTILSSYDNKLSFDRIKSELCPTAKEKENNPSLKSILSESQMTSWLKQAKDIFKDDPFFTITKEGSKEICTLRTTPITSEEKQYQQFRNEQDFEKKLSVLRAFIANDDSDLNSDEFQSMISFFEAKSNGSEKESVYAYLLLNNLKTQKNFAFINLNKNFEYYFGDFSDIQKIKTCFASVKEAESRKLFVDNIVAHAPNWQNILVELLNIWMSNYIVETIKSGSDKKKFVQVLSDSVTNNRINPELFIYLAKNATLKEWQKAGYSESELLTAKLVLLSYLSRQIANSDKSSDQKIVATKLAEIVFKNDEITKVMKKLEQTEVRSLYSLVQSLETDMFDEDKKIVESFIKTNFDFGSSIVVKEEKPVVVDNFPKNLLCSKSMLQKKHEEFIYLRDVELPANSKDIGEAKALGDLRENSEYQYAKDKRKELNARFATLSEQLDKAKIVAKEDVNPNTISFGTVVILTDNLKKKDVTYTILGPWESDPDNNILNFQAPMGRSLYNMKVGQTTKFEINGTKYDFTVKDIKVANFE